MLSANINSFVCEKQNVQHFYLIEWNKNESHALDQLVYRLKLAQSLNAIAWFSHKLIQKIESLQKLNIYDAVVPIPSSQTSRRHAINLAQAISKKTGLPLLDCLEKMNINNKAQKHLKLIGRQSTRPFNLKRNPYEEFTRIRPPLNSLHYRFLFVDDVLTTGESFRACQMLLTQSKQNDIATLFFRPFSGAVKDQ